MLLSRAQIECENLARTAASIAIAELQYNGDLDGDASTGVYGDVDMMNSTVRMYAYFYAEAGLTDIYDLQAYSEYYNTKSGVRAKLQKVVQIVPLVAGFARGAITAKGDVDTLGTIVVDGRDHDYDGLLNGDPGTYGVSTMALVNINGASTVGGGGEAPSNSETANNVEENAVWTDGYPPSPDAAFGLDEGTLKAAAQASGTYFTNSTDLNAFLTANGGVPGGIILYADFDNWTACQFGPTYNDPPSIIVNHNAAGNAEMKNLHGKFRGLVMSDVITHINGDADICGAVMSFADENLGNCYGNGNAHVKYSSEVLSMLPGATTGDGKDVYHVLSWEVVPAASLSAFSQTH